MTGAVSRHNPEEGREDCSLTPVQSSLRPSVSTPSIRRTLMMTASQIIISLTDKNVFTNISTRNCSVINTKFLIKASVIVKKKIKVAKVALK